MNYAPPEPTPRLVRPEWQKLVMLRVQGQKLRTRDATTFPSTTAQLVESVLTPREAEEGR